MVVTVSVVVVVRGGILEEGKKRGGVPCCEYASLLMKSKWLFVG